MKSIKSANNGRPGILKGVSTLDVKNMRVVLLFLAIIAFSNSIYAGHSILDRVDPTFDPQVQTNSYGWKWVNNIQVLPDGKFLAYGGFNTYNGVPVGKLVRLNADGSLDPTFNNQTVTASSTGDSNARIILQPDGKILLKGGGLVAGGREPRTLIRLNADGTFDPGFDLPPANLVGVAFIDSLGRYLIGGNLTTPQGPRRILRLNNDGSIDSSFNFIPAAGDNVQNIALQGGRLIVASDNDNNRRIYRLNENGSEDPSFTPLTGIQLYLTAVQPDNKILYQQNTTLLRLNENGGSDGTFQSQTLLRVINDTFLKFTSDSKIVIVNQQFINSAQISRFLPNGAVDPSFPQYTQPWFASLTIQSDDSIVIGDAGDMGGFNGFHTNHFVRLTSGGVLDPTFNSGGDGFQTILPGVIQAIETYPDGKVLLAGKFDLINNIARSRIARLNADSTVDTSFQVNTTSGSGNYFSIIRDIYQIRAQADGKIVLTGFFDYVLNGEAKKNFVRLNSDGSIDATFNLIPSIPDWSQILIGGQNRFATYSDGKLMVGTSKSTNGGLLGPLKLMADGARDTSFNPTLNSTATSMYIDDLAIQPDGKIVASGTYENNSNNNFKSFVARFNTDGSLDPAFPYTEEPGRLYSRLALLPSGKILISKYALGGGSAKIRRLNSNGSVDNSFNSVSLSDSTAKLNSLLVLPNGKIFAGGKFTITINGEPARNLLQLDEDGSFASTIYALNDEVLCLATDSDGRVLVGGGFTVIGANGDGETRSYVARLTDSRTPFDFDGDGRTDIGVFRPLEGYWYLDHSTAGLSIFHWGLGTDRLAPADYDGDGKADVGIYRDGQWWYFNSGTETVALTYWGSADDIPMPSDFDGDGKADFVFFQPTTGMWYRLSSTGVISNIQFGLPGDIPLIADFDGDGKADPTIFRPTDGVIWYMSSVNGWFYAHPWGQPGDIPVLGDYDGDGKTDAAVFRGGLWRIFNSRDSSVTIVEWGYADDRPTPGDYDGDGKTDFAIYRPSNGMWFAMRSTNGFFSQQFGLLGDKAVPNAFLPEATSDRPVKEK
jgi:uncharacterized delta-60 repeat protein